MNERSKARISLALLGVAVSGLFGCQSTQSSREELARICADPANRQPTPGNLYYDECRALYPVSARRLSKIYFRQAPVQD
jgi:hypothetical protein